MNTMHGNESRRAAEATLTARPPTAPGTLDATTALYVSTLETAHCQAARLARAPRRMAAAGHGMACDVNGAANNGPACLDLGSRLHGKGVGWNSIGQPHVRRGCRHYPCAAMATLTLPPSCVSEGPQQVCHNLRMRRRSDRCRRLSTAARPLMHPHYWAQYKQASLRCNTHSNGVRQAAPHGDGAGEGAKSWRHRHAGLCARLLARQAHYL